MRSTFLRLTLISSAFFAVTGAMADYQLLVTETISGSVGASQWLGMRRYYLKSDGSAIARRTGIDKSLLNDPAGVNFNSAGELFISNRHGNSGPASVSRFTYSAVADDYSPSGTITGNSLAAVHSLAFRPGTGEMFVCDAFTGFSRFTFSGGTATANGFFSAGQSRWNGFANNADNMYFSTASNYMSRYNVATGVRTDYPISGSSILHWGDIRDNVLYIADYGTGNVYQMGLDAAGAIVSSNIIANAPAGISVVLSPDKSEMFVAGHTSGNITRFRYNSISGTWQKIETLNTGVNMGGMTISTVVPTPITISGKVTFGDWGGATANEKISVRFKQQGIDMEDVLNVPLAADGSFSFQTTRRGAQKIGIRGKHWLRKFSTATYTLTQGTNVTGVNISLLNGDIDGDNSVTILDYSILSDYFDAADSNSNWNTTGGNGFKPKDADLDGDGTVSILDYSYLSDNFDADGE